VVVFLLLQSTAHYRLLASNLTSNVNAKKSEYR
jgi:hypothetical protein